MRSAPAHAIQRIPRRQSCASAGSLREPTPDLRRASRTVSAGRIRCDRDPRQGRVCVETELSCACPAGGELSASVAARFCAILPSKVDVVFGCPAVLDAGLHILIRLVDVLSARMPVIPGGGACSSFTVIEVCYRLPWWRCALEGKDPKLIHHGATDCPRNHRGPRYQDADAGSGEM